MSTVYMQLLEWILLGNTKLGYDILGNVGFDRLLSGLLLGEFDHLTELHRIELDALQEPRHTRNDEQEFLDQPRQVVNGHLDLVVLVLGVEEELLERAGHLVEVGAGELVRLGLLEAELGQLDDLRVDEARRRIQLYRRRLRRFHELVQVLFHLVAGARELLFEFFVLQRDRVCFGLVLGGRAALILKRNIVSDLIYKINKRKHDKKFLGHDI